MFQRITMVFLAQKAIININSCGSYSVRSPCACLHMCVISIVSSYFNMQMCEELLLLRHYEGGSLKLVLSQGNDGLSRFLVIEESAVLTEERPWGNSVLRVKDSRMHVGGKLARKITP